MTARFASVLLGVLVLAGAAAPGASARGPCNPRGSETLARNSQARVYEATRGWRANTVYACLFAVNRPLELGLDYRASDIYEVRAVRLAGRLVGYATLCGCRSPSSQPAALHVVDLRRRRHRFHRDYSNTLVRPVDLELKRNGSVAWTTRELVYEGGDYRSDYAVWKHDAEGDVQLDSGSAIDPESLALDGDYLYWRHGAEARTATLR